MMLDRLTDQPPDKILSLMAAFRADRAVGWNAAERPAAILTSVILFVLCAVYVALGVRSFIAVWLATV